MQIKLLILSLFVLNLGAKHFLIKAGKEPKTPKEVKECAVAALKGKNFDKIARTNVEKERLAKKDCPGSTIDRRLRNLSSFGATLSWGLEISCIHQTLCSRPRGSTKNSVSR